MNQIGDVAGAPRVPDDYSRKLDEIDAYTEESPIRKSVSKAFASVSFEIATEGAATKHITADRVISLLNKNNPELAQAAIKSEKVFNAVVSALSDGTGKIDLNKLHNLQGEPSKTPEEVATLNQLYKLQASAPTALIGKSRERKDIDQAISTLEKAMHEQSTGHAESTALKDAKDVASSCNIKHLKREIPKAVSALRSQLESLPSSPETKISYNHQLTQIEGKLSGKSEDQLENIYKGLNELGDHLNENSERFAMIDDNKSHLAAVHQAPFSSMIQSAGDTTCNLAAGSLHEIVDENKSFNATSSGASQGREINQLQKLGVLLQRFDDSAIARLESLPLPSPETPIPDKQGPQQDLHVLSRLNMLMQDSDKHVQAHSLLTVFDKVTEHLQSDNSISQLQLAISLDSSEGVPEGMKGFEGAKALLDPSSPLQKASLPYPKEPGPEEAGDEKNLNDLAKLKQKLRNNDYDQAISVLKANPGLTELLKDGNSMQELLLDQSSLKSSLATAESLKTSATPSDLFAREDPLSSIAKELKQLDPVGSSEAFITAKADYKELIQSATDDVYQSLQESIATPEEGKPLYQHISSDLSNKLFNAKSQLQKAIDLTEDSDIAANLDKLNALINFTYADMPKHMESCMKQAEDLISAGNFRELASLSPDNPLQQLTEPSKKLALFRGKSEFDQAAQAYEAFQVKLINSSQGELLAQWQEGLSIPITTSPSSLAGPKAEASRASIREGLDTDGNCRAIMEEATCGKAIDNTFFRQSISRTTINGAPLSALTLQSPKAKAILEDMKLDRAAKFIIEQSSNPEVKKHAVAIAKHVRSPSTPLPEELSDLSAEIGALTPALNEHFEKLDLKHSTQIELAQERVLSHLAGITSNEGEQSMISENIATLVQHFAHNSPKVLPEGVSLSTESLNKIKEQVLNSLNKSFEAFQDESIGSLKVGLIAEETTQSLLSSGQCSDYASARAMVTTELLPLLAIENHPAGFVLNSRADIPTVKFGYSSNFGAFAGLTITPEKISVDAKVLPQSQMEGRETGGVLTYYDNDFNGDKREVTAQGSIERGIAPDGSPIYTGSTNIRLL